MKVDLRAGATIDLLNKQELDDSLEASYDRELRELARGIKFMRVNGNTYGASGGQVNQNQFEVPGPDLGFVWNLKLVSAILSSSSVFNVYLGSQSGGIGAANVVGRRLIGRASVAATLQIVSWSSSQMLLNPGESITLDAETSTSLITDYLVTAIQAPAEMAWKIL